MCLCLQVCCACIGHRLEYTASLNVGCGVSSKVKLIFVRVYG